MMFTLFLPFVAADVSDGFVHCFAERFPVDIPRLPLHFALEVVDMFHFGTCLYEYEEMV